MTRVPSHIHLITGSFVFGIYGPVTATVFGHTLNNAHTVAVMRPHLSKNTDSVLYLPFLPRYPLAQLCFLFKISA